MLGSACTGDNAASSTREAKPPPPPPVNGSGSCPKPALSLRVQGHIRCLSVREQKTIYADLARARDRGVGGGQALAVTARERAVPVAIVTMVARIGAAQDWPLPPAPRVPRAAVRRPGGAASATRLISTTQCSTREPGNSLAVLRWRPAVPRGREQRVVVTGFRNFAEGSFESSGRLAPTRSTFEWHRVHGQAIHSWRVLTRRGTTWSSSVTGRFVGPTCVTDGTGP